ncbi:MAG TPA: hypothetical protein ENK32_08820, partial [Anaerolineae bacterium]|nr:hypothetical protein [Anaerolineae bacterium]
MLDYDLELNIEQELSEIPPEYQDAFRQAIERELADPEQNRTDTDILAYLRQRRDDFKRGGFIRPDGRPGLVTLSPEAMYEQALPQLAQNSLGEPDNTAERRRTLIKIGIFAGAALLFLFFVFRGRAQREGEQEVAEEGTPAAAVFEDGTPVPAPPLPEITGVDDSLQTIGSLGGALTIVRPSAIELTYGRTEETIALAIDPSKSTPKGELRYNETTMLSDNPVAVWLFGTVLNYAIGIPDSMARNLEPGDRVTLNTDTGASLHFVVAETGRGANYEAGRLLSQNRLGLTLFALPAAAEDDVSFAVANYDVASEEEQAQTVYETGERAPLGGAELQVLATQFSHTEDGSVRIVVDGAITGLAAEQAVMLSLASANEQTTAVPLTPDESGAWRALFILPGRGEWASRGEMRKTRHYLVDFNDAITGNDLAHWRVVGEEGYPQLPIPGDYAEYHDHMAPVIKKKNGRIQIGNSRRRYAVLASYQLTRTWDWRHPLAQTITAADGPMVI